jgi:hypothetical protein
VPAHPGFAAVIESAVLRKVWLATLVLEEVMRTGPSDRTNAAEVARFAYLTLPHTC